VTFDLLVLAVIAAFILYRLYLVLGQRTGFDGKDENKATNVISLDAERKKHKSKDYNKSQVEEIPPAIRSGIQQITRLDPEFSLKDFTEGATAAFEMIVENYIQGNLGKISKLLSPELFEEFKRAVNEREQQGHVFNNTLIKIEKVEVQEAHVSNNVAYLKVKYVSEQVPVLKDNTGNIIEGNPHQIDQIIDYWVFERNLKSSDPNWILIETDS
jgi:predicted lipid-binding transport protein (Tim44 family)